MSNHLLAITRLFVDTVGSIRWADAQGYAGPRFTTTNLPTCTANLEGTEAWVRGATGVASSKQVCLKQPADTYAWTQTAGEQNDEQFAIYDDGDSTKRAMFEASGITTATTRTYTFPNASGTISLANDMHVRFIGFQTLGIAWTNMPAAATEIIGSSGYRQYVDTTNMNQVKLGVGTAIAGHTTAILYLEYSTNNGSSWNAAVTSNADQVSIAGAGFTNGTWQTLVAGAKGDYLWRIVGSGGNATADPNFVMIAAQFRS